MSGFGMRKRSRPIRSWCISATSVKKLNSIPQSAVFKSRLGVGYKIEKDKGMRKIQIFRKTAGGLSDPDLFPEPVPCPLGRIDRENARPESHRGTVQSEPFHP